MFKFVRSYRAVVALLLALGLVAAACGSDADSTEAADDAAETTDTAAASESQDAGESDDEAMADEDSDDEAMADEDSDDEAMADEDSEDEAMADDASGGILVDLGNPASGEFSLVLGEDGLTAGDLSFAVVNNGENPHAFAIARGTSYEDLPQKDNGAVDTDALGADFLGNTANLQTGEEESISFALEAGDYVFFCPVEFGPNSHAKAGQVLSVSVG